MAQLGVVRVRVRARAIVLCGHVGGNLGRRVCRDWVGWLQVQEQSKQQAVEVAANHRKQGQEYPWTVTRRRPSAGYAARLL